MSVSLSHWEEWEANVKRIKEVIKSNPDKLLLFIKEHKLYLKSEPKTISYSELSLEWTRKIVKEGLPMWEKKKTVSNVPKATTVPERKVIKLIPQEKIETITGNTNREKVKDEGLIRENELDSDQLKVVNLSRGYNIVLAPPGCGKTRILAERVMKAVKEGISPKDMLCLTFTNRAARDMRDKVNKTLKDEHLSDQLFVGNLHRYCSSFLFSNKIIAQTSAILDEKDALNILLHLRREQETEEPLEYEKNESIQAYYRFQHYVSQLRSGHSEAVLLDVNGSCSAKAEDFCREYHIECTNENIVKLYERLDTNELTSNPAIQFVQLAKTYELYKERFNMVDFDDLLLEAYNFMVSNPNSYKKYSWIQIDEVQDLNRLQLAIVDCLYAKSDDSVMLYLGDEQQAIFSFIGAKLSTLEYLKERCGNTCHHLGVNYRSPKYLLDVYNTFAIKQLNVNPSLLPVPQNKEENTGDYLQIVTLPNNTMEKVAVATIAEQCPINERTAILVPVNRDADEIEKALHDKGQSCFPAKTCSQKKPFSSCLPISTFAAWKTISLPGRISLRRLKCSPNTLFHVSSWMPPKR